MSFFHSYISRHSFRHTPHKWLVALVLTPLYLAQQRYKNTYHLKFAHAKKLFFIDMMLLLGTVLLFVSTLVWWLYDPTITELVDLSVRTSQSDGRLKNGDMVTLHISYANHSDIALVHARLELLTPPGFVLEQTDQKPDESGSTVFNLPDIPPGQTGTTTVVGRYFGTVHVDQPIETRLRYMQSGSDREEVDISRLYLTPRESSVSTTLSGPERYLLNTPIPVTLHIENTQDQPLEDVTLEMGSASILWQFVSSSIREITSDESSISIPLLEPHALETIEGTIRIVSPLDTGETLMSIGTLLDISGTSIYESETSFPLEIAHPNIHLTSSWSTPASTIGQTEVLSLSITNTGNTSLEHPTLRIGTNTTPIEAERILPGQTVPAVLSIPVRSEDVVDGQDGPIITPTVLFEAALPDLDAPYTSSITLPALPIGTTLSYTQSSRYYTTEGDQLGRGPLPPQVGKETKYWVFTQISNGVGTAEDVVFSTILAPGAVWTGKSSVTKGGDISYSDTTHTATWQVRRLEPHEIVGIYFEIAITPALSAQGTIPKLLTSSALTGHDPFVNTTLSRSSAGLSADLASDILGSQKGTIIQ